MKTEFPLAQLRHLYSLMLAGHVKDTAEAARGLLGPSIEALERAALSAVPENVARDAETVGYSLGIGTQAQCDSALAALSRLATAAARVPGLERDLNEVMGSMEAAIREAASPVALRPCDLPDAVKGLCQMVAQGNAALRARAESAESERDAARQEVERENAPNGNDLTALRAALASIFPGVSFQWSALPSMLLALDSQRGEAEARATAAEAQVKALEERVRELHGDFIMSGPDAQPTPAPGLREAVGKENS